MNEQEAIKILKDLKYKKRLQNEEHRKRLADIEAIAIDTSKQFYGIEVGDKIIVKGKPAIIRKITNPYISLEPVIQVSFLKKDGTPRADIRAVHDTWEKAND